MITRIEHEYRGITFAAADGYEIETEDHETGPRLIVSKNGRTVFSGPINNWLIFYKEVKSE